MHLYHVDGIQDVADIYLAQRINTESSSTYKQQYKNTKNASTILKKSINIKPKQNVLCGIFYRKQLVVGYLGNEITKMILPKDRYPYFCTRHISVINAKQGTKNQVDDIFEDLK